MPTHDASHAARIRDQFTRQAEPFAALRIHHQADSLDGLRVALRLAGGERVLDAGCGPGLVACHLAPRVRTVVGIDATPAMVAQATARAQALGHANATFQEGLMERLPLADGAVDAVVTRYTFHHLLDAAPAMAELARVCRPGGRVVVCDAAPRAPCRAAYDAWERLRDPSHTSVRTPEELAALATAHLEGVTVHAFRLETGVEALIGSSFPDPGAADRLRARLAADVGVDALDLEARWVDGELRMAFPILVVAGNRPAV